MRQRIAIGLQQHHVFTHHAVYLKSILMMQPFGFYLLLKAMTWDINPSVIVWTVSGSILGVWMRVYRMLARVIHV